jgi:metal-dependent amidase/aminoacylase/carboxypeptidase family protein
MFATNAPTLPIDRNKIRPDIRALQPQLVDFRRQLHQRPELGFEEQLTAAAISQKLTEWGIPHQTGIAKTGIVAAIQGRKTSFKLKTLAIRADMDALPIQEANDVPYNRSTMGKCTPAVTTAIQQSPS